MEKPDWLEVLLGAPTTFLRVDTRNYKLALYIRPKGHSQFQPGPYYDIAIGAKGHETPAGIYIINSKVKYPDWMVPDSEWAVQAGLIPGTVYEGGTEENPLKERWLGVTDPSMGVGIHGTASKDSIGSMASHGCIRMLPKDVIELYNLVPKKTIIEIK
jgi:lipoprotein-anchoring transpeptidase ErfK/SrfK